MVELRIYEGGENNKQDITFSYHANFFLYITLENARAIAQGRVPTSQSTFPVLTGMPVAGMAYLDRPAPAGYFIFPDLSVRHEGKYRLSFNLFEEPKDPKDGDAELGSDKMAMKLPTNGASVLTPSSHVYFRLEVKSEPFAVYSAKKFPGLKESTPISRVVSEQGCRVRIRRDVRMRRRDTKSRGGYDDFDDESVYERSERYISPESYKPHIPERPRSISNGGNDPVASFHMEHRRPSIPDLSYYHQTNYQPLPSAAPAPNVNYSMGSHLAFGNTPTPNFTHGSFHPPINQPSTSLPGSNEHHFTSTVRHPTRHPNAGYGQTQSIPNPIFVHNHTSPSYMQSSPIANPLYSGPNGYPQMPDYRQPPISSNNLDYVPRHSDSYPGHDARYGTAPVIPEPLIHPSGQGPSIAPDHALPPLKVLEPSFERRYNMNAPVAVDSPSYDGLDPSTPQSSTFNQARGKRSFDAVFDTSHINQPLHSGLRPSIAGLGQDIPSIEADDGYMLDGEDPRTSMKLLSYRRADGSKQSRKCPSPVSE